MSGREIAGLAVIGVGLLFMLVGLFAAWGEARKRGELGGASGFVEALAKLVEALSGQRTSLVLFTFGTLLVFLGGVILGVGALTA